MLHGDNTWENMDLCGLRVTKIRITATFLFLQPCSGVVTANHPTLYVLRILNLRAKLTRPRERLLLVKPPATIDFAYAVVSANCSLNKPGLHITHDEMPSESAANRPCSIERCIMPGIFVAFY
jgi:hypothetical protein